MLFPNVIPTISAVEYELGEQVRHYRDIPDFEAQAAAAGIGAHRDKLGLKHFRMTELGRSSLLTRCATRTLARARRSGRHIDAAVLCGVHFPETLDEQLLYVDAVQRTLELSGIPFFGCTLNRCASLLSGLVLANSMVLSGQFDNVLVLGGDVLHPSASRLESFAIFSDGAASCLVSREAGDFTIVKVGWATQLLDTSSSFNLGGSLAREATLKLGLDELTRIKKILPDNLFRPLIEAREQIAGFKTDVLFLDNVSRTAHVYSCDPLINLVDYTAQTELNQGTELLLASSTPGVRIGLLLRTC